MDLLDFDYFNYTDANHSDILTDDEENSFSFIFIIYGVVIFFGVLGNASLFITIYIQPSGRPKNPLLAALCMADLLVVGISAPLTLFKITLKHHPWFITETGCKAIYLLQVGKIQCPFN